MGRKAVHETSGGEGKEKKGRERDAFGSFWVGSLSRLCRTEPKNDRKKRKKRKISSLLFVFNYLG